MLRRSLIVSALLLAGCGGATASSTTLADTTTTAGVASSSTAADGDAAAPTPTTAPPRSTSEAPTTTTNMPSGESSIRVDEIVFAGGPYLVISNRGSGPGSTAGHWICQFPAYYELPAVDLLPGEKIVVQLGAEPVPELAGVVASVDVSSPIGNIRAADGELGLYLGNNFNSADAIVDYVEWGNSGHARSSVAVEAGLWEDGGFIEVPAEALAIVADAVSPVGPADWFAEIGG